MNSLKRDENPSSIFDRQSCVIPIKEMNSLKRDENSKTIFITAKRVPMH